MALARSRDWSRFCAGDLVTVSWAAADKGAVGSYWLRRGLRRVAARLGFARSARGICVLAAHIARNWRWLLAESGRAHDDCGAGILRDVAKLNYPGSGRKRRGSVVSRSAS